MGFINGDEEVCAALVCRYRIEHDPEIHPPSENGRLSPHLTSVPMGMALTTGVRAQGAAVAKGIWWQKHWDFPRHRSHLEWYD